jgi:hypothetical protein
VFATAKFVEVQNFLQAKALLEHSYVVFICDPVTDLPLYACSLRGDMIIFVEYVFPNAAILRQGDWTGFEKLYDVAREYNTPIYTIL